jgi:hypothetical protein
MKYTIEQKAQIMAMQNQDTMRMFEYENVFVITDGYIGYYIQKSNWLLNIEKFKDLNGKEDKLNPEIVLTETTPARRTKTAFVLPSGDVAVKLKTETGIKAWVNTKYIKQFGDGINLRIQSDRDAIYISNYKGTPLGVVLPIKISDEELD